MFAIDKNFFDDIASSFVKCFQQNSNSNESMAFLFVEHVIKIMAENRCDLFSLSQYCATSSHKHKLCVPCCAFLSQVMQFNANRQCEICSLPNLQCQLFTHHYKLFQDSRSFSFLPLSSRGTPFWSIGEMTMHDWNRMRHNNRDGDVKQWSIILIFYVSIVYKVLLKSEFNTLQGCLL